MSPSAIYVDNAASLAAAGMAKKLQSTAPSLNGTHLNGTPGLAPLDASLTTTTKTTTPQNVPALGSAQLLEAKTCTDHMLTASWSASAGWSAPEIRPYAPLAIAPTASVLHYATSCFEGLKLYRGFDGRLRLFRPDRNCARMLRSATRIALPGFEPLALQKLIQQLCAVDGPKWLPKDRPGSFLYVRPTMIADDAALGVQRPKKALLFVVLACFAPMDENPKGLGLLASEGDMVRAWPGGFGWAKVGANYGPTLLAQGEARQRGYEQVLWLYPGEGGRREITEAGASNLFLVWRKREGGVEMVTAPLDGKIILDGVTRRSVLELARQRLGGMVKDASGQLREKMEVVERKIYIDELVAAVEEGRMIEAFAAGTAYFIAPVSRVGLQDRDLEIPMQMGSTGLYTAVLKGWLKGIMYGQENHPWAVVIEEL